MKRKVTAVLLTLVLMFSLCLTVSANTQNSARDGVVVVATLLHTDSAGSQEFGWGSGFFVTDQYLVTNYHVVEEFVALGSGKDIELELDGKKLMGYTEIRVYYDSSYFVQAALIGYDETRDLALLKLSEPTTERKPLNLRIPTEDMVGSFIYAVGFPGLADNWYSRATESWGKTSATVTSGTISRLFTQGGSGQQNIQTNCEIMPGNSGGPVVDMYGDVVGVATWNVMDTSSAERIYYAVNVTHVIDLLNQYGVKYTPSEGPTTPTSNPTDPTPTPPGPDPERWLVIVCIAVIVILAAALVVVFALKKKKPAPAAPVAPVAPAHMPAATVRSFAQSNYGASVVVTSQPVIIGRSNVCALRFPGNAPGISGSHCSIQWDSATQSFIVTDLNSSYGTYLMTGQRLQPNQPYRLRAGERIYLGEQANVISLNLE